MELTLENDLVIQCNNCRKIHVIDKDSLELNTSSYERQMGEEVEYDFEGDCSCDNCGNYMNYKVRGFEYPMGCLNYDDSECYGGTFVQSPTIGVNYYEFEYSYADEEDIYTDVNIACWNIDRILNDNKEMYNLSPREFEQMVAQIFRNQGYEVRVTQATRDGGCDIVATHNIGGLPFMILIECKKYNQKNKVGVSLIRSLLGVQTDQRANKAVLVTSSTFTKDARDFAARQQQLITLLDFDDLLSMMKN